MDFTSIWARGGGFGRLVKINRFFWFFRGVLGGGFLGMNFIAGFGGLAGQYDKAEDVFFLVVRLGWVIF